MGSLNLSLDPRTLEAASGRQKVAYVDPDGGLVYEEPKLPGHDLSEQVGRIWHEYPEGLLDITEAKLAALPAGDAAYTAPEDKKDKEDEARVPGQALTHEEMHDMRINVQDELNAARNELWFVLELAKTLAASSEYSIDPPEDPLAARDAQHAHGKKQKRGPQPQKQQQQHTNAGRGSGPLNAAAGPSSSTTASTSLAAQQSIEPPVLPPGTYTTTPASLTTGNQAHAADTYSLQLAIAAKEQAVMECEALIDAAVDEMQGMSEAAEGFWASVRALQSGDPSAGSVGGAKETGISKGKGRQTGPRGQWALLPKPDFARVMRDGDLARDVVIPYAVDEAPPAIRARCLAAFDLDPNSKQPLAFGARTHLRLRIVVHDESTSSHSSASSTIPLVPDNGDVGALMQTVQDEAFDEELFGEIRADVIRLGGRVEGRTADLDIGTTGQRLTFELYDSRSPPSSSSATPISTDTPDLILLSARYLLLQLHRRRKIELVSASSSSSSAASAASAAEPTTSIVAPILQGLIHIAQTKQIQDGLERLADTLRRAGLDARVESTWGEDAEHGNADGLEGVGGVWGMMSGTVALEVDGLSGVSLTLQPGSLPLITASPSPSTTNTFPTDPCDVPHIAASTLSCQLLPWAHDVLIDRIHAMEGDAEGVFLDELDGSVALEHGVVRFVVAAGQADGRGEEEVGVEAVYETYDASEGEQGEVKRYKSTGPGETGEEGGESLRGWLHALV